MKRIGSLIAALVLLAVSFTHSAQAQKAGSKQVEIAAAANTGDLIKLDGGAVTEPSKAPVTSKDENAKAVNGKSSFLRSHIKSVGTIGVTDRYEIVSVKIRGLDTPNVAGFFIYDRATDGIVGVQTAGAPGLGVAIVNGGSYVAGNYLFGSKLKPNKQTIENGSSADSGAYSAAAGLGVGNGGSSTSTGGNATGGAGGNGTGNGGAGGNGVGNGGNGGAGGAGGHVPPGLIDNPGHDGTPGNPHN